MRRAIDNFAQAMEDTLKLHDEEKGREGWLEDTDDVQSLFDRLTEKRATLEVALLDCDENEAMKKAVDLANFAMMIYDRIYWRKINYIEDAELAGIVKARDGQETVKVDIEDL